MVGKTVQEVLNGYKGIVSNVRPVKGFVRAQVISLDDLISTGYELRVHFSADEYFYGSSEFVSLDSPYQEGRPYWIEVAWLRDPPLSWDWGYVEFYTKDEIVPELTRRIGLLEDQISRISMITEESVHPVLTEKRCGSNYVSEST